MKKKTLLFICGNVHDNSSQGIRYHALIPEFKSEFEVIVLSYTPFLLYAGIRNYFLFNNESKAASNSRSVISIVRNLSKPFYKKIFRPFVFPDRYKFLLPKYYTKIVEIFQQNNIDKVVIGLTPFSLYQLAVHIKHNYPDVEVTVDLSDPFTFNGAKEFPLFHLMGKLKKYEQNALKSADKLIVLNPLIQKLYLDEFLLHKVFVIEQGLKQQPQNIGKNNKSPDTVLRLVYAGGLYKNFREASELYRAVDHFEGRIELHLFGNIQANLLPLRSDHIFYHGMIPHHDLAEKYLSSDAIVFIDNDHGFQVPGKILEIQASGKPILFLYKNKKSPTLNYLHSDSGIFRTFNHSIDIISTLNELLNAGDLISEKVDLSKFYWPNLAKKYIQYLND